MNYESEIIVAAAGLITTAVGWILGGHQKSKRDGAQMIGDGAEKLIQTSQGLLDYLEKQRRIADTKTSDCEGKLQEYAVRLEKQDFRIEKQDKIINKMNKEINTKKG